MPFFVIYVGTSADPTDQSMRVVEAADMEDAKRLYPDAIAVGVVEDRQIDNGLNITALKRGFVRVM